MNKLETKAIALTGHRFIPFEKQPLLKKLLVSAVTNNYEQGFTTYYCGMAVGFDMLAAEVILELKNKLKDLKLIAVLPFQNQSDRFSSYDKKRYQSILEQANEIVTLRKDYCNRCFLIRDDYMVEQADAVIAYLSRTDKGGTYYTCKKAQSHGLPILNLF